MAKNAVTAYTITAASSRRTNNKIDTVAATFASPATAVPEEAGLSGEQTQTDGEVEEDALGRQKTVEDFVDRQLDLSIRGHHSWTCILFWEHAMFLVGPPD